MPANATFTEMVTTTLRHHPSEVTDNISENNVNLTKLGQSNIVESPIENTASYTTV